MSTKRILVAYASRHGATAEIAGWIAERLRGAGLRASVRETREVDDLSGYDAVVLGGALYARRWPRDARRFVRRHRTALRGVPVWLFSSGPLDESAETNELPPTRQVARLAARLDARGHATFGGAIQPTSGAMARSMAAKLDRTDFRNRELVNAWADRIARALIDAGPQRVSD